MTDCIDGRDHDFVEVITYKEVYRHCIRCTEKQIKKGDNWEVQIGGNVI